MIQENLAKQVNQVNMDSNGPEFGTILCALDHTGHVVAKYAGVGAATSASFNELIGPHLNEMTILCSDATQYTISIVNIMRKHTTFVHLII